jgi:ankyrin repeat protein
VLLVPRTSVAGPIHDAAYEGKVAEIQALLDKDATLLNAPDPGNRKWSRVGSTPLHYAAGRQSRGVVELLLHLKADVSVADAAGGTPLHAVCASYCGSLEQAKESRAIARLLLKNNADVSRKDQSGNTPLHDAVKQGDPVLVAILVEHQADVGVANRAGRTPLHQAVQQSWKREFRNQTQIVEYLLTHKANVNAQDREGKTPLHVAVAAGLPDLVDVLLKRGADVNLKDQIGLSPFHEAVWGRNTEIAALLSTRGGRIDARLACAMGNLDHVKEFLKTDSAITRTADRCGRTLLHWAAKGGQVEVVEFLLSHAANPNCRTTKELPEMVAPLHIAIQQGDARMVKTLLAHGANVHTTACLDARPYYEEYQPIHQAASLGNTSILKLSSFR